MLVPARPGDERGQPFLSGLAADKMPGIGEELEMSLPTATSGALHSSPKRTRGSEAALAFAASLFVLGASPLILNLCAQEAPRCSSDDQLAEARKLVQKIAIERVARDDKWQPVELVKEPILRFSDPTRDDTLGSIWVWGERGRPAAILELYLKVDGDWLLVFNNISGG